MKRATIYWEADLNALCSFTAIFFGLSFCRLSGSCSARLVSLWAHLLQAITLPLLLDRRLGETTTPSWIAQELLGSLVLVIIIKKISYVKAGLESVF